MQHNKNLLQLNSSSLRNIIKPESTGENIYKHNNKNLLQLNSSSLRNIIKPESTGENIYKHNPAAVFKKNAFKKSEREFFSSPR